MEKQLTRREMKKQMTREKILSVAQDLFFSKGYDEVSIVEIANNADLGTGTVYNYFKSKDDVFLASIAGIFETVKMFENMPDITKPKEVTCAIVGCLHKAMEPLKEMPLTIYKEMMRAMMSSDSTTLLMGMRELDLEVINGLATVMESYKQKKIFKPAFDSQITAELIHAVSESELIYNFYYSRMAWDEVLRRLDEKIGYILDGYLEEIEGSL